MITELLIIKLLPIWSGFSNRSISVIPLRWLTSLSWRPIASWSFNFHFIDCLLNLFKSIISLPSMLNIFLHPFQDISLLACSLAKVLSTELATASPDDFVFIITVLNANIGMRGWSFMFPIKPWGFRYLVSLARCTLGINDIDFHSYLGRHGSLTIG